MFQKLPPPPNSIRESVILSGLTLINFMNNATESKFMQYNVKFILHCTAANSLKIISTSFACSSIQKVCVNTQFEHTGWSRLFSRVSPHVCCARQIWSKFCKQNEAWRRVWLVPVLNALGSSVFHNCATSFAKGSSGLGALSKAWIESSTVRIWRAGDHLSGGMWKREKKNYIILNMK